MVCRLAQLPVKIIPVQHPQFKLLLLDPKSCPMYQVLVEFQSHQEWDSPHLLEIMSALTGHHLVPSLNVVICRKITVRLCHPSTH